MTQVLHNIKKNIKEELLMHEPDLSIAIENVFDQSTDVFDGLHSEFQQQTFIKSCFDLVPFKEEILGKTIVPKKKGSKVVLIETIETFIYIPLLESLRQLLGNDRIRDLILKPARQCDDGIYYDICDGSVFKNDNYFKANDNSLQLILYHDEVEVCNPLGSKAGIHKLDMYYYTLGNIDPKFRSKHCAVRLLAIVNAKHVSTYGINKVMAPIVSDLKKLYNGVTLRVKDSELNVCGKVLLCAGDTLGQHALGGFKEGVGFSFQKCRTCYCHFEDMQCKFEENSFKMRSKDSYNSECNFIDDSSTYLKSQMRTLYGINNRSILCDLPDFDIIKQMPQDIMHTILEGVLQYEVRLVLLHYITQKNFTLAELNTIIVNHNYGYTEVSDKPGPLKETVFNGNEKYKLKYKAAQSRLFLKLLPFFLHHFIDADDKHCIFDGTKSNSSNYLCSSYYFR